MFTGVFLGFEVGVDGDAGVDLEAAVRGDLDAEPEQLVDSALVLRCRVGELGLGVGGELVEGFELGLLGGGLLLPEVELLEVPAEGQAFVGYLGEGVGELGVIDLVSGVGADDPGFFHVELVQAAGDGGSLVALLGLGLVGGVEVPLAGVLEALGVGEDLVDGGPDGLFEGVGG